MGIDCNDLGLAKIIRRDGTVRVLSKSETIDLCEESMSTGVSFQDILKRTEPDLKVIRFIPESEAE